MARGVLNREVAHEIVPGTLWAATDHEKFRFIAHEPTRLIYAFTPPFTGAETGFAELS